MELWTPTIRLFMDSSHFWMVTISLLGFLSALSRVRSLSYADTSPPFCCQVQGSPFSVVSGGNCQALLSSGAAAVSSDKELEYKCLPGLYVQDDTLMMPNTTCPWSDLHVDSMQQCPIETKSTYYQLGGADAFIRCNDYASSANPVYLRAGGTEMTSSFVGARKTQLADSDNQDCPQSRIKSPECSRFPSKTPGCNSSPSATCPNAAGCCEGSDNSILRLYRYIHASSAYFLSPFKVDLQQDLQYWMKEHGSPALKYFVTKLDGILRLTTSADSFMSLRLSYRQGFRNRLDSFGYLCQRTTRAISVPTISANRLLPQKSGWIFRKRVAVLEKASPAEHTPEPEVNFLDESRHQVLELHSDSFESSDEFSSTMAWQLQLWDHLANDFGKQSTMPGLRSGNTVIDERNFVLGRGW